MLESLLWDFRASGRCTGSSTYLFPFPKWQKQRWRPGKKEIVIIIDPQVAYWRQNYSVDPCKRQRKQPGDSQITNNLALMKAAIYSATTATQLQSNSSRLGVVWWNSVETPCPLTMSPHQITSRHFDWAGSLDANVNTWLVKLLYRCKFPWTIDSAFSLDSYSCRVEINKRNAKFSTKQSWFHQCSDIHIMQSSSL